MSREREEYLNKENLILREKILKITRSFNEEKESLHDILIKYVDINKDIKAYNINKSRMILKNSTVDEGVKIREENRKLSVKYIKLIYLMKRLLQLTKIKNITLDIKEPYYKLLYDKSNIPICLVSEINKELDGSIKNIRIVGASGDLESYNKYDDIFMECHLHLINQYSDGILIFITKVDVKGKYRLGRGTLIINYIEKDLLKEVEKIMMNYYKINGYNERYGKITSIGGYIANTGATSIEKIKAFYKSLGYDVVNRSFNKIYRKVETI